MRTIVRFSLDHDYGSELRNMLAPILEGSGLVRTGTGTYEGSISASDLGKALAAAWAAVAYHTGSGRSGRLDHFWMYSDNSTLQIDPVVLSSA